MIKDMKDCFEKFENEFLKFDRIKKKLSPRPDLHAFLLLDDLVPVNENIINAAEHDEFWLSIDIDELAKFASEDNIRDLVRCGVMYHSELDCLYMFA